MDAIFHLAFHVTDLEESRTFYIDTLDCKQGDEAPTWIDLDFFGHQLSLHLGEPFTTSKTGLVDKVNVSMPHFGAILPMARWREIVNRLTVAKIEFEFGPSIRYEGETREQATVFFRDPSGNPIELKGFKDFAMVFNK